jgi:type IV pilus assembly protein PilY1
MKTNFLRFFLLASLLVVQGNTSAEDIDLFSQAGAGSGTAPNVLLVIDNAANFSSSASPASAGTCTLDGSTNSLAGTVGGIEQCALYTVLDGLPVTATPSINIGVMAYNGPGVVTHTGADCTSGSNGGCLLYPITGLTPSTKPALLAWIKGWKTSNSGGGSTWLKASSQATGATMQEAWAYFQGRTGLSGYNYASIKPAIGCNKNFVIFVGNSYSSSGSPGDATGSTGPKDALEGTNGTALKNAFPAATSAQKVVLGTNSANAVTSCGTASIATGSTHQNKGFYADEWARYMLAQASITTYTIGVLGSSCQAEYAWLLGSMADVGGGKYFPTTNYAGLKTAFETIISEVQSVNSVFASVSLPVSVSNKDTFLNQVFVGMFRPDGDSLPRWAGNLKQYQLGDVNGVLKTVDADGVSAISSSGSDFIGECARSFWTPVATSAGDGYWTNLATANCAGYPATSNSPDGNVVEKGGHAYVLRASTPSARPMKTCSPVFASCTTLTDFNTSNGAITQALLDSSSSVTKDTLVDWARGTNSKGEAASVSGTPITTSAMRPSVHGDVVHSRPVAVNMGTDASPKVMVFYGANDGVLRAINGNQTASFTVSGTSVGPGAEIWSFMPPEFYSSILRLYNNTSKITTPSLAGVPKNYGMDGPVVGYKATSGNVWIFAGMRRGGRAIYAFEIDASTRAISLKWKRGCGDTGTANCTNDATYGDYRQIGQTWATPTVVTSAAGGAGAPLLLMGGGYDTTCEDAATCTTTATGNHIYVINADTGKILKDFATDRSVVGDIAYIPDSSGHITYAYATDLGGNVYRISGANANTAIGSTAPASWTITKIASLGCATATTCTSPPNRKFINGPNVLVDTANAKNIILVGSGDRERPLNTSNSTSNYFFRIDDKPTVTTYLSDESSTNCPGQSVMCLGSLLQVSSAAMPTAAQLAAKKGWYRVLAANEQVVTTSVSFFGIIKFATNTPQVPVPNSCTANLGLVKFYTLDLANGENPNGTTDEPFVVSAAGGLPPNPVVGQTMINGVKRPFLIGCDGSLEACDITPPTGFTNPAKIRSYWYIRK